MSQSFNSKMDTNIFAELLSVTTDNKTTSAESVRGTKRVADDQKNESQAKKTMFEHHSNKDQSPIVASKRFDKPKFVSAAEMVGSARTDIEVIPELSDKELLAMAIDFEKKYPK